MKTMLLALLIVLSFNLFSQEFSDIIVNKNNDTIKCEITFINENDFTYKKRISNSQSLHTSISIGQIAYYELHTKNVVVQNENQIPPQINNSIIDSSYFIFKNTTPKIINKDSLTLKSILPKFDTKIKELSISDLNEKIKNLEESININCELHHTAGKNIIISYVAGITGSILLSSAFKNKALRDIQKPSSYEYDNYNVKYSYGLVIGCAFSGIAVYTGIKSFVQHYFLQTYGTPKLPKQSEYVN